ncbi:jg20949, partial [Pararge aegeria aegeria]
GAGAQAHCERRTRAYVRAVLLCGSVLAVLSHVFFSTLVVLNNSDLSTLLSSGFMYALNVFKAIVTLEYACLLSELSATLAVASKRFGRLAQRLGEDDYENNVKAHVTLRDIKYCYLSMYRLIEEINKHEGVALLGLLAANTFRTISYIYVATSAYYTHGSS